MKNRLVLVALAICLGFILTWGVLRVSASQYLPLELDKRTISQDVGPKFSSEVTEILSVYVENASGQPAVNAFVNAYAADGERAASGKTGEDGYVQLSLAPGLYTVAAFSQIDNFYLYQTNMSAPGTISITTQGASQVTLTAKSIDATPLNSPLVEISVSGMEERTAFLGSTIDGILIFYITPGVYNIGLSDPREKYCLFALDQDFTNPTSIVDFDMSVQPYGMLGVEHPFDETSGLELYSSEANIGWFVFFLSPDQQVIVSTNIGYTVVQTLYRTDAEDIDWNYYFDLGYELFFDPAEEFTFWVGGPVSATGRTADATVGDTITLANVVDIYNNTLTYVYTFTPGAYLGDRVYPDVQLTDPDDGVTQVQSLIYKLPVTSPLGMYAVDLEWETGPYQGLLTAQSQFEVLPRQISAIIPVEGGSLYSPWDDTLYEFSPGTFSEPVVVTHTVQYRDLPSPIPLVGIGHFYDVEAAYTGTGVPAQPTQPYTLTIGYTEEQKGAAIEDSLSVYNWNGAQWVPENSQLDLVNHQVVATPDHFSTWGILGETNRVYLSMVSK